MTPQDWPHLKYFRPNENWGDPAKMKFELLWLLDSFREYINQPVYVVCGTQGRHVKDSQHYLGKAVDIVIDAANISPADILLSIFRFPISGIGLMPLARYDKYSRPFGLHLDCRDVSSLPRGITQATWIAIPKSGGANDYYPLTEQNLRKFSII